MAAAYSAHQLGVAATIVVPSVTPDLTVERLRDQGATVVVHGKVLSPSPRPPVPCCSHILLTLCSTGPQRQHRAWTAAGGEQPRLDLHLALRRPPHLVGGSSQHASVWRGAGPQ